MRTRQKLSQNFFSNRSLASTLIRQSTIKNHDTVIEIGPGQGILTVPLAHQSGKLIVYEIDKNLAKKIESRYIKNANVTVYNQDFLQANLPTKAYKIFSNIPFNITSDVIKKCVFDRYPPLDMYLFVQKEVAFNYIGTPLSRKNSLLSILLFPFFDISVEHKFSNEDFFPRPAVDVVLLRFRKRDHPLVSFKNQEDYYNFIVFVFNQFNPNVETTLKPYIQFESEKAAKNLNLQKKPSLIDKTTYIELFELFMQQVSYKRRASFKNQFKKYISSQRSLQKIHRTRRDPNWHKNRG